MSWLKYIRANRGTYYYPWDPAHLSQSYLAVCRLVSRPDPSAFPFWVRVLCIQHPMYRVTTGASNIELIQTCGCYQVHMLYLQSLTFLLIFTEVIYLYDALPALGLTRVTNCTTRGTASWAWPAGLSAEGHQNTRAALLNWKIFGLLVVFFFEMQYPTSQKGFFKFIQPTCHWNMPLFLVFFLLFQSVLGERPGTIYNPPPPGSPVYKTYKIGDKVQIRWSTTMKRYSLVLWQRSLMDPGHYKQCEYLQSIHHQWLRVLLHLTNGNSKCARKNDFWLDRILTVRLEELEHFSHSTYRRWHT